MKATRTTQSILLTAALAALLTSLVIMMGVQLDRAIEEDIVTRFSQRQLLLVEQTAASIQSILDEARRDLLHLKGAPGPACLADALGTENEEGIATCREMTEQDISSYLRSHSNYMRIRYIDASGQEIAGVDVEDKVMRIIPQDQLRSQTELNFFVATMQLDEGEIYVSRLEPALGHGEVGIGLLTMRLATPIFDSQGGQAGIIVLNLLGEDIRAHIGRLSIEEGMDAWVLDGRGVEIINVAHPEQEGSNAYEYCRQTGDETLVALTGDMMAGGRGTGIYLWPESMGGSLVAKRLAAYTPVFPAEGQTWSVGASVPYDTILAAHRQTHRMLLLLGGGIVAIILIGAVLIAGSDRRRAVAEEQARFSETLRRRGEELEALQEISLAINSQLELDELLQNVVERGRRLLDTTSGNIYLVDETKGDLQLVVSRGYTRDYTGTRLVPGEGLSGKVLQSGAPLTVNDYSHWEEQSPDWEAEPLTAVLGVPLKRGEQIIGVMGFAEIIRARSFDEHDVWLATLFASQAAIAIENARLYQAEQSARESANTLREVSCVVGSTLELDDVLSLVLRQAKRVLTYDTASILLFADGKPAVVAVTGYEDEELVKTEVPLRLDDSPILQTMARDHRPIVIADVRKDERWIWVPGAEDICAWVGAPLLVRDEMIGALMIDSTQAGFYTVADAIIAQALANQVAVAIENARLYQAEQRGRSVAEALQETARVVNTSLNLDKVVPLILEQLAQVIEYDSSAVLLLDDNRFKVTAGRGFPDMEATLRLSFGADEDTVAAAVLRTRRPLIIEDAQSDPRWQPGPETAHIHGWIGAPLIVRDQVIGVLTVDSRRPGAYSEADGQLVFTFANQAAVAIENARLFEETQEHVTRLENKTRDMELVHQMSRMVSSSLDLTRILETTVEQMVAVFEADHSGILLFDQTKTYGQVVAEYPSTGATAERFPVQGYLAAERIIADREPLVIKDAWNDPLMATVREAMHRLDIRSMLIVPLVVKGEVVGSIGLDAVGQQRRFDAEEVALAQTVANQAAIAIENARLFEAERQQRAQAEALREAGIIISSALHPDEVLERLLEQVERIVPCDSSNVMLIDDGTARIAHQRGYERFGVADEMTRLTLEVQETASLRHMVETGQPYIVPDVAADPGWVATEAVTHIRSYAGAPIVVGGKVVGLFSLDKTEVGFYQQQHAELLTAFARHAAVAIENARLFEAEQRRAIQLATVGEVGRQITSLLELDPLLDHIVNLIHEAFGYYYVSILLIDPATEELALRAGVGYDLRAVKPLRLKVGENGICGWVAASGEPLLVGDVSQEPRYRSVETTADTRSELVVPIQVKGQVIGVLDVQSAELEAFDRDDLLTLYTLADQVAAALENAGLYQELHDHAEQLEQRVQERTAQLQAQYARLDAILRSASDGIIVTDAGGEIIQANPVAQTWLTQTLSPDDAAWLQEAVQDLARQAEGRPETTLELTGLDLELKAAPISEPGMEEAAAVVAVHDVSHLKALDRVRSRFVSNVSHELRTPVTTIKLYAALMQRTPPERWGKYLDALAREADRQAQLVEDILQISHIDTGRLEMGPRPTPLNELTDAITTSHQVLAQDRGLTLEHRPAKPGPVALVDPERMTQVLSNLVSNAVLYTPEGGHVMVSTETKEADGRAWATATVEDTGMGIPEKELLHIFDRFFRGEKPRLMQISGTGLGLAIAKEIVELHGGRVTVESQVDVGATFTVWLPLAKDQA